MISENFLHTIYCVHHQSQTLQKAMSGLVVWLNATFIVIYIRNAHIPFSCFLVSLTSVSSAPAMWSTFAHVLTRALPSETSSSTCRRMETFKEWQLLVVVMRRVERCSSEITPPSAVKQTQQYVCAGFISGRALTPTPHPNFCTRCLPPLEWNPEILPQIHVHVHVYVSISHIHVVPTCIQMYCSLIILCVCTNSLLVSMMVHPWAVRMGTLDTSLMMLWKTS